MSHTDFAWKPSVYLRNLKQAAAALRRRFGAPPDLGIIFGSGLGEKFFSLARPAKVVAFQKIPHFTAPNVAGHEGKIYLAEGLGQAAAVLHGRCHYYEGYSPEQVVFPLRAFITWGVKCWVITNAAGSLNPQLKPGDLVQIRDHLNLTGANPLRGPNLKEFGPRFPSLSNAYLNNYSHQWFRFARQHKIRLKIGVYVGISGPSYETPAEVKGFRKLGGDVVGMSTVMEVIAAAHAGCKLTAFSAVTNSCTSTATLSHEEVLRNAAKVDGNLSKLLWQWLNRLEKKRKAAR